MSRTHSTSFERDDETEVTIEYTISPYDPGVSSGPAELCYPPEGGEVEIIKATVDGKEVSLTDEEGQVWATKIQEEHDFSDDDYDDWRPDYD
jgi:hypothetical protein